LTNITDVDGKLTTLTYTNIGNYSLVKEVTDPYGRKAVLSYDSSTAYPVLTNITDAIEISSSMLYDNTSFNLIQLSTPYTSVQFLGLEDSTGGSNKVLWIKETGVSQGLRNHVYLYADTGDTNKMTNSFAAWRPQTTNASAGYSFPNTFDAANSHLRNSFHWNPVQYAFLPSAFTSSITNSALDISSLMSSNYLHARMRHWLLTTNALTGVWSASTSLSIERASSPDGVMQGQITWYDYDNKLSGDPQWKGTSFLPRYIAWTLPNGESRFTYNLRNSLGYPTNVIETYNDSSANLKVRTNSYGYAANKIDLI